MHIGPLKTSEELNSEPHPLFSMGGKRHLRQEMSEGWQWRQQLHTVDKCEPWADKEMSKIITDFLVLKPKVERIGGQDDFNKLV